MKKEKFIRICTLIGICAVLTFTSMSCTNPLSPRADKLWGPVSGRRKRASSWNRSGVNFDYITFAPGQRKILLHNRGRSGYIMRIWFTLNTPDSNYLKNVKIRCTFDGITTVDDVPIGMFTATGPWRVNDLCSAVNNVMRSPDSRGVGMGSFNIGWSMPFANEVKIEFLNQSNYPLKQHYYIDYMEEDLQMRPLLFHGDYKAQKLTTRAGKGGVKEPNLSKKNNYEFANIQNCKGRYVGTVLAVESHPDRPGTSWYEGDDMFFIDGETWPPSLHGTGTEDYFGMAWGVHRVYQAPDHGVTHYERNITDHDRYFDGRFVLYRWHTADPIVFHKSLHASIEAGHGNDSEQHYQSVSFWYGAEL